MNYTGILESAIYALEKVWKKTINIKIENITKNLDMYVVKYISDQIKKPNWEGTSGII